MMTGVLLSAAILASGAADDAYWVEPMRQVHARFRGEKGTFAQFGDSITVTLAFWTPMLYERKNAPKEMEEAFQAVKAYLKPKCWREWKGPAFGSEGGMTIRWAHANIEKWLKTLNPETALIMFGTNDLGSLSREEYRTKTREVVERCLDNGTVVILSTIPPRHRAVEKAATFAQAVREIAREMKVPLTDFHAEVLKRRPEDWDGALDQFRAYSGYDVPTLIARDGVHPSHPKKYADDYSEEALRHSGYMLRNYLALGAYAEVMDKVLKAPGGGSRPATQTSRPARPVGGSSMPPAQAPGLGREAQAPGLGEVLRQPWFPKAPAVGGPRGRVVSVADAAGLRRALDDARPGDTISVADGTYRFNKWLDIKADNVTLCGASGRREAVVLDGGGIGELIRFTRCAGVTVADLTIQNVQWNGFKINSETGVQKLTIHNCVIHNVWQRGVKGVKVPEENRQVLRPSNCRVQYCLFYNDHAKRFEDDPADTAQNFDGNYIGGIDVMYARGWTISDNVFVGIQGRTRAARGAVFLWHETEDCIVERNVIIDCDSGICLGNSHKPADVKVHATRCVVRNNFVTRSSENGILADYTKDCRIANNTVHDPASRLGRLIRLVHENEGLVVANNLLSGPNLRNESKSPIDFRNNLMGKDLSAIFVNAATGNLHLKAPAGEVAGQGGTLPEVTDDIDRRPRGAKPDIGAHEFSGKTLAGGTKS